MSRGSSARALLLLGAFGSAAASQALTFNFSHDSNMDANAVAGFTAAGQRWSSLFSDDITVNIDIAFEYLGSGILGATWSNEISKSYTDVRAGLVSDAKSGVDFSAISSLQAGSTVRVKTNRWLNNPHGTGSATPYEVSLSTMSITSANAKALGLVAGNDPTSDASISFSTGYDFDFNPTNGIDAGKIDFVGIATHEIGHALGFISGVDTLEWYCGNYNDNGIAWVTPLDLFRTQTGTAIPYLCADNTTKYFSLDGSATSYLFSNGQYFGDGNQASHWKDDLGLGIMDPTAAYGEKLLITDLDVKAFDAIGYDAVPEPATMIGLALGGLALLARKRRKA